MKKRTIFIYLMSVLLILNIACNSNNHDSLQSLESNVISDGQKEDSTDFSQETAPSNNASVEISSKPPSAIESSREEMDSVNNGNDTKESQTEETAVASQAEETFPNISNVHLEDGSTLAAWEADVTDEADIEKIYLSLQSMEDAGVYEEMMGGYAVMITITDGNENSSRYLVTTTNYDKIGHVLVKNLQITENPANIENFIEGNTYYKWFYAKNDIWEVLNKYGNSEVAISR